MKIVISLFDYTGEAGRPWAEAGYTVLNFDLQHPRPRVERIGKGFAYFLPWDASRRDAVSAVLKTVPKTATVALVMAFPPCTDLAASGARHWARKRSEDPFFQDRASNMAKLAARVANKLRAPYVIENPTGALGSLWRGPDYKFDPYEYGGYIPLREATHPTWPKHIPPRDAYPKKTWLWTGNGFKMPARKPVDPEPGHSRQHKMIGGKSQRTKNIRSATPRGFARAVFEANV